MRQSAERLALPAGGLFIAAYFLWYTPAGWRTYFTADDMINLYTYWTASVPELVKANLLYFSPFFRPLAALYYKPLFALFGFEPLPFRLVFFALLLANLWLAFAVARRLTGSAETALLATLIGAYNHSFGELYYNSGTVYDVLCFTFYFSSLLLYLRIRERGEFPDALRTAAALALYICALNAKEMAVTLPAMLGIYEWVFHGIRSWRGLRTAALAAAATLPYVLGKTASGAVASGGYRMNATLAEYVDKCSYYVRELTYDRLDSLAAFAAMFVLAWLWRSRALKFAWLFAAVSVLPVAFIPPRTAFVLYIPMVGIAMFVAVVLVEARDCLLAGAAPLIPVPARAKLALFLFTALFLVRAHARTAPHLTNETVSQQPLVRSYVAELKARHPSLAAGSRVLLVDDPKWANPWTPYFILVLYYRDARPTVDRVEKADAAAMARYDLVFGGPRPLR